MKEIVFLKVDIPIESSVITIMLTEIIYKVYLTLDQLSEL